jgi:hypothetical protein
MHSMTPINNSDTAWLIVSDHNQDNNLPYEDLREDILNPETNQWQYEHHGISLGNYPDLVGGWFYDRENVGDAFGVSLVTNGLEISIFNGRFVGDEDIQSIQVGGNYDPYQ